MSVRRFITAVDPPLTSLRVMQADGLAPFSLDASLAATTVSVVQAPLVGDGVILRNAVIAGTQVTGLPRTFTSANVGQGILLPAAGPAGADLVTTIVAVSPDGRAATIATPATTGGTGSAAWGTDNGPVLQAFLASLAGTGATVLVQGGQTYFFGTGVDLIAANASGLTIQGYGATFVGALPSGTFDVKGVLWLAKSTQQAPLNLQANAGPGGVGAIDTIRVTDPTNVLQPGQTIMLLLGVVTEWQGGRYVIRRIAGNSGTRTLTLDRAVLLPYPSATAVVFPISATLVDFTVRGIRMSGSCSLWAKYVTNLRCAFVDCICDGSLGSAVNTIGYELCTTSSSIINVTLDGTQGFELATCESIVLRDCRFYGDPLVTPSNALTVTDCTIGEITNFVASGFGTTGIFLGSGGSGTVIGCTSILIRGGSISGGAGVGVSLSNAVDCLVEEIVISGNGGNGVTLPAAQGTKLHELQIYNNTFSGIGIGQFTSNTTIDQCDLQQNGATDQAQIGISGPGKTTVLACHIDAQAITSHGIHITSSAGTQPDVYIGAGTLIRVARAPFSCILTDTAASMRVELDGVTLEMGGGAGSSNNGINHNAGVVDVKNTRVIVDAGTDTVTGILSVATTTVRLGLNVDLSAAAAVAGGHDLSVAGFCSKSLASGGAAVNAPVALAGAAAVNVSFPDLKSTERILLALRTRGATPDTHLPLVTLTPGTGFSVTGSAAGVNDVLDWMLA